MLEMNAEIHAAYITAVATVLAACIGVAGAALLLIHRKMVIRLCKAVEGYHQLEGQLVRKILSYEDDAVTEEKVKHWRGRFRAELGNREQYPLMSANEAIKIRHRYFGWE